jgi:diaminopimelate decarboxylase
VSARLARRHATAGIRSGCAGAVPLPARLERWQVELCSRPELLSAWLEEYGSPLNVIDPAPLTRNAGDLQRAAAAAGVPLKIFFARKANKALALIDEATSGGLGIDVASERELAQALGRGVPAADIVVTAAVKPRALLERCVASGATAVIDNEDELALLAEVAGEVARAVTVAFRLAPAVAAKTRFGLAPSQILRLVARFCPRGGVAPLAVGGVHFHLDGYAAADRVDALGEALELVDELRERGQPVTFVDIGGGVPMRYLDDGAAWELFWSEHRSALAGRREPLTFEGHGLGLTFHAGEIIGRPGVYPSFQTPVRGEWLEIVLRGEVTTRAGRETAAAALRARNLELRCEPGRSLLDGCGFTAARVSSANSAAMAPG